MKLKSIRGITTTKSECFNVKINQNKSYQQKAIPTVEPLDDKTYASVSRSLSILSQHMLCDKAMNIALQEKYHFCGTMSK